MVAHPFHDIMNGDEHHWLHILQWCKGVNRRYHLLNSWNHDVTKQWYQHQRNVYIVQLEVCWLMLCIDNSCVVVPGWIIWCCGTSGHPNIHSNLWGNVSDYKALFSHISNMKIFLINHQKRPKWSKCQHILLLNWGFAVLCRGIPLIKVSPACGDHCPGIVCIKYQNNVSWMVCRGLDIDPKLCAFKSEVFWNCSWVKHTNTFYYTNPCIVRVTCKKSCLTSRLSFSPH